MTNKPELKLKIIFILIYEEIKDVSYPFKDGGYLKKMDASNTD